MIWQSVEFRVLRGSILCTCLSPSPYQGVHVFGSPVCVFTTLLKMFVHFVTGIIKLCFHGALLGTVGLISLVVFKKFYYTLFKLYYLPSTSVGAIGYFQEDLAEVL